MKHHLTNNQIRLGRENDHRRRGYKKITNWTSFKSQGSQLEQLKKPAIKATCNTVTLD